MKLGKKREIFILKVATLGKTENALHNKRGNK